MLALEPADMFLGVKLKPDPLDQIELGFVARIKFRKSASAGVTPRNLDKR